MKKEKVLTSDEFKAKIDNHEDFILVDLLPASDYARTHIQGAINIPLEELETKANQWLSHQIDIIVYSSSPTCHGAEFGQEYLATHGFRVWRLEGGIEEWIRKAYPLEGDPNYKPRDITHNPLTPKPEAVVKKPQTAGRPQLVPAEQQRMTHPTKPGNIAEQPTPKSSQAQTKPIPKKKVA